MEGPGSRQPVAGTASGHPAPQAKAAPPPAAVPLGEAPSTPQAKAVAADATKAPAQMPQVVPARPGGTPAIPARVEGAPAEFPKAALAPAGVSQAKVPQAKPEKPMAAPAISGSAVGTQAVPWGQNPAAPVGSAAPPPVAETPPASAPPKAPEIPPIPTAVVVSSGLEKAAVTHPAEEKGAPAQGDGPSSQRPPQLHEEAPAPAQGEELPPVAFAAGTLVLHNEETQATFARPAAQGETRPKQPAQLPTPAPAQAEEAPPAVLATPVLEAPFEAPEKAKTNLPKIRKKSPAKRLGVAALCLLLVAGVLAGYSLWRQSAARQAYAAGQYARVVQALDAAPWMRRANDETYRYSAGRLLLEEGDAHGALQAFEALGAYEDSPAQANHARYALAHQHMEAGALVEAHALFAQLGSYTDSANFAARIAAYQAAEATTDPLVRHEAFAALDDFLDSENKATAAAAQALEQALLLYEEGEFAAAGALFGRLPQQGQTSGYTAACALAAAPSANGLAALRALEEEGIPVGAILLSDGYIRRFLDGEWHSADGGGTFLYDYADRAFYLPDFEVSGDYMFYKGQMLPREGNIGILFGYEGYDVITLLVGDEGPFTFHRQAE
ncbi:hypothetical protein LJC04_03600, partial [Ruminococcaceae bacterium OttesenSCG-928-O06]|nr:hypothetical protein [Ruminococcaceae bacterium OttesenSCG-928-O06]